MRWLTLYARSRRIPAAFAAVVVCTALMCVFAGEKPDARLAALVLVAGVASAGAGLAGDDVALDRIAAIRWPPRRAAHVLLVAVVVGVALLALQCLGNPLSSGGVILRDSFGLAGLAAFGATMFGGQFAWLPPIAWYAVSLGVRPDTGTKTQVVTWLIQPPASAIALITALTLGIGGTLAYAVLGYRR